MRFAKNTQHDTSKVLRLPRKMAMDTSKVLRLPRKLQHIFWKRRKSIAPATQNDFRHVPEHVWMSRSATPATRNEATTRLKPPKITTSAELPIGTAIRSSRGRLRTVADGCARERNVERTHPQPPDPQSETGTLATHSGKKQKNKPPFLNVYVADNIYSTCKNLFKDIITCYNVWCSPHASFILILLRISSIGSRPKYNRDQTNPPVRHQRIPFARPASRSQLWTFTASTTSAYAYTKLNYGL